MLWGVELDIRILNVSIFSVAKCGEKENCMSTITKQFSAEDSRLQSKHKYQICI